MIQPQWFIVHTKQQSYDYSVKRSHIPTRKNSNTQKSGLSGVSRDNIIKEQLPTIRQKNSTYYISGQLKKQLLGKFF